ncbi:MAG: TNT domain-containing protein [Acidaminococcaceae bacterium]
MQDIEKYRGLRYTLGKEGYDRFLSDNSLPLYPRNDGFIGSPIKETLTRGSIIIDRYGCDTGRFVSPKGTGFEKRSLPKESINDEYHEYKVKQNIENVLSGRTAAWFEQIGGGWQYKLPDRIVNLSDYLEENNDN